MKITMERNRIIKGFEIIEDYIDTFLLNEYQSNKNLQERMTEKEYVTFLKEEADVKIEQNDYVTTIIFSYTQLEDDDIRQIKYVCSPYDLTYSVQRFTNVDLLSLKNDTVS